MTWSGINPLSTLQGTCPECRQAIPPSASPEWTLTDAVASPEVISLRAAAGAEPVGNSMGYLTGMPNSRAPASRFPPLLYPFVFLPLWLILVDILHQLNLTVSSRGPKGAPPFWCKPFCLWPRRSGSHIPLLFSCCRDSMAWVLSTPAVGSPHATGF